MHNIYCLILLLAAGAPPAPRLDMACCVISWSIEMDSEKQVEEVSESLANASLEAQEGSNKKLKYV